MACRGLTAFRYFAEWGDVPLLLLENEPLDCSIWLWQVCSVRSYIRFLPKNRGFKGAEHLLPQLAANWHHLKTLSSYHLFCSSHGIINYIDTKAKCRNLKICPCKGALRQVFICVRLPPLIGPHTPKPRWLTVSPVYTLINTFRKVPL